MRCGRCTDGVGRTSARTPSRMCAFCFGVFCTGHFRHLLQGRHLIHGRHGLLRRPARAQQPMFLRAAQPCTRQLWCCIDIAEPYPSPLRMVQGRLRAVDYAESLRKRVRSAVQRRGGGRRRRGRWTGGRL